MTILTDEAFERLKKDYETGFKLCVIKCPRCKWTRGFFFYRDGTIGFDPGCFCNSFASLKSSCREYMDRFLSKHPEQLEQWFKDAEAERQLNRQMQIDRIAADEQLRARLNYPPKKQKQTKPSTLFELK